MKRARDLIEDTSDLKKLKSSIAVFKVQELQEILTCFQINKCGRKSELQERLLSLIEHGKLNAIDRRKLFEKINQIILSKQSIMCSKTEVEVKRVKTSSETEFLNGLPIQPDVKFKKIPFYEDLNELIRPSTLIPINLSIDQTRCFIFSLTPQQAEEIDLNRISKPDSVDYVVQVQVRICLLETTSDQNDLYPQNFQIRVNNRICTLPPFLPARPNTIPKRSSKPLNITPFVKCCASTSNVIEVRWQKEPHKNFVIACNLVRKLTSEALFQRLDIKGEDFTRGMIKEKLSKEIDSEIATTMLRVSLNCPLGKIRMNMPCRASTCKHLQCFDALSYLRMNECKQSWICPVCDNEALFNNLAIDGYFLNVIKSLGPNGNEIQLHSDGSWSKLDEQGVKQTQMTEEYLISDDEDDNNNKNHKHTQILRNVLKKKIIKNPASSAIRNASKVPLKTIDLTLDDSD